MLQQAKAIVDILVGIGTLGAGLAGAWWFLYTTQSKPRLQFDLGCRFIARSEKERLAELQFIVENKGFVEHRLYDLSVSVHGLVREAGPANDPGPSGTDFPIRLFPKTSIVAPQIGYYFVRPGVRQVITRVIHVPSSVSAIRVTAGFLYERDREYPHTARRIFEVAGRSDDADV